MKKTSSKSVKKVIRKIAKKAAKKVAKNTATPVLLSGGNPQIAKADGDAPVQAYIAALSGWQREIVRRIDALVVRAVPSVQKSVKWNSPLYAIEGLGRIAGIHTFAKYIKVAFFRGASLRPVPPGESKQKEVRYIDIRENETLDEKQFVSWVKQASKLTKDDM
ncbi:MAG: DUF1801 domain-containing protein [Gemmatimonadaceae bacterium]